MTELRFSGQAPSQVARHFLELLDDVNRIHGLFQEEITTLRARVAELEACNVAGGELSLMVPDSAGCAVYLVSKADTIQSWSGGASAIYGYSVEDVIGQPWAMLQPRVDRREDSARPCVQVVQRMKKDGCRFEVYLHYTTLLDARGQPCGRMHAEIPLGLPGSGLEGGSL